MACQQGFLALQRNKCTGLSTEIVRNFL